MDTDIRDEIERSFGEGPTPPATDLVLTEGRRALRRRRLVEGASAVLVAVVVVTATGLAAGGRTQDSAPAPATQSPTAGPTKAVDPTRAAKPRRVEPTFPPPVTSTPVPDAGMRRSWPAAAQEDGLHVLPGLKVLRYVDDPWHLRADGLWSVAVAYRDPKVAGQVIWWAGYVDRDRQGSSVSIPSRYAGTPDFDAWVADQKEGMYNVPSVTGAPTPEGGWPGITNLRLVRFVGPGTEQLEPLDAVTLVRQRAHPDLPDSWATSGDRSAVAEVRFEGVRYYVLARSTGGGDPQYIAVKAAKGGATLDDFLDLARQRYAEGGGGLK